MKKKRYKITIQDNLSDQPEYTTYEADSIKLTKELNEPHDVYKPNYKTKTELIAYEFEEHTTVINKGE